MKNIKVLLIIIGLILFIVNFLIIFPPSDYFRNDGLMIVKRNDFRGIQNLELKGVIFSVNNDKEITGDHGRRIIRLKIIETNMDEYDPRNKQANYYCIIKNGKAEIYETLGGNIGDSIVLNIPMKRISTHYLNGEVEEYNDISIGYPSFFDYIKKKGYQEL